MSCSSAHRVDRAAHQVTLESHAVDRHPLVDQVPHQCDERSGLRGLVLHRRFVQPELLAGRRRGRDGEDLCQVVVAQHLAEVVVVEFGSQGLERFVHHVPSVDRVPIPGHDGADVLTDHTSQLVGVVDVGHPVGCRVDRLLVPDQVVALDQHVVIDGEVDDLVDGPEVPLPGLGLHGGPLQLVLGRDAVEGVDQRVAVRRLVQVRHGDRCSEGDACCVCELTRSARVG